MKGNTVDEVFPDKDIEDSADECPDEDSTTGQAPLEACINRLQLDLHDQDNEEYTVLDDSEDLRRLGLPTAFGSSKNALRESSQIKQRENSPKYIETYTTTSSVHMGTGDSSDIKTNDGLLLEMSEMKDLDEAGNSASTTELNHRRGKKRPFEKGMLKKSMPQSLRYSKIISRYYARRFSLFSRFDEGIQLDEESWFSVTPEKIAKHIALRLKCDTILDAFCGSGGNAIQFAFTCERVIAIDLDPEKISLAKNNAKVYGVENRIDFIIGDFFKIGQRIKADHVFLSPPWGGPNYVKCKPYDIEKHLLPESASILLTYAKKISTSIALYVPRNTDDIQLTRVAGIGNQVEIENNYLDKKFVAKTAYFGDLISQS